MRTDLLFIFSLAFRYPSDEHYQLIKSKFSTPDFELEFPELTLTLDHLSSDELQETYTTFFDLNPVCTPWISFQLFPEDDFKRNQLMVKLSETYAENGFYPNDGELPDHIATVLEFLSGPISIELKNKIIQSVVITALTKMKTISADNFYHDVICLTLSFLNKTLEPNYA